MVEKRHVYLTGLRGTGKTTVGHALATAVGRTVIDLDGVVSANAGKSIREIFQAGGEKSFRELESQALECVSQTEQAVISLGGGAILRESNRAVIRATGICFWLECSPEILAERLRQDAASDDQRPALTSLDELQEIRETLKLRHALYEDAADYRIDTAGQTIDEVASQIIELLKADTETEHWFQNEKS